MRKQTNGGTGSAVLAPGEAAAPRPGASVYRPANDPLRPRRELIDHYADDEETEGILRGNGRGRRIRRGLIPKTRNGWIVAGVASLICLSAVGVGSLKASQYLTRSAKFRIPASKNIEIDGNNHLTRAQMLSVFGEDIDGNIFRVPMEQRRAQLEAMPWIEHATVMRLLPNRIRVHVEERVPVAFTRQGGSIGLVDANGVLLDVPPDAPGSYAFPVVAGIKAEDSPAARADRMKLYAAFLKDMDSDGKGSSAQFSEIDLSDPEDVKALLPDGNSEVLVHFGTENFLARYKKYGEHIVEWRTQYPRLSSVDMRYERQVVLQMPPKDSTVASAAAADGAAIAGHAKPAVLTRTASANQPVAHASAVAPPRPSGAKPATPTGSAEPVAHASLAPAKAAGGRPATAFIAAKAVETSKPAHGTQTSDAQEAATRRRVEAIKAWMAKREKTRAAAAAHAASNASGQAN